MNQTTNLLTMGLNSETAIAKVIRCLSDDRLQVVRSFDLQAARSAHTHCTCPNHGTEQCDCQMIVLLVYGQYEQPLTLVAHSQDGQTQIELVDTPQQHPERLLKNMIIQALTLEGFTAAWQAPSANVT